MAVEVVETPRQNKWGVRRRAWQVGPGRWRVELAVQPTAALLYGDAFFVGADSALDAVKTHDFDNSYIEMGPNAGGPDGNVHVRFEFPPIAVPEMALVPDLDLQGCFFGPLIEGRQVSTPNPGFAGVFTPTTYLEEFDQLYYLTNHARTVEEGWVTTQDVDVRTSVQEPVWLERIRAGTHNMCVGIGSGDGQMRLTWFELVIWYDVGGITGKPLDDRRRFWRCEGAPD